MERFAQLVVAGGLLLVAGLRGTEFTAPASSGWLAAATLAGIGCAAVLAGILTELDLKG
ncbi:hypothetical protein [Halobacterium bonnevillei]|uniref:hypothetical protein n=1 Tax=Halobacterium bonnevillei TaxID=2692200 RepID=UPI001915C858|nr:hypothetical protein [Halobacterium bonnevillei]